MSIEEKTRQLDLIPVPQEMPKPSSVTLNHEIPADVPWAGAGIGALLVDGTTPADKISLWSAAHTRLGIPPLIVSLVRQKDAGLNLSATWDENLAKQAAAGMAVKERARGVNALILPLDEFGAQTLHAENAALVGAMEKASIQGVRQEGLAAIPAYFPFGVPAPVNQAQEAGERELRMNSLPAFEPWIREEGLSGMVISAGDVDGVPIPVSSALLRGVVRSEWGFQGFTLAAPGAVRALNETEHEAASAQQGICQAINAGIDMQWSDYDTGTLANAISECVRNGVVSMATLDHAVGNVLRAKLRLGLLDASSAGAHPAAPAQDVTDRTAAESLVLLRNEHHLLPLSDAVQSLLVVEPSGSSVLADALRKQFPRARILADSGRDLAALDAEAKEAAVAIVVPEENADSNDSLVKRIFTENSNTVAVVEDKGRPLRMGTGKAPAVLEVWELNDAMARAAAAVLAGTVNPSGRLPASMAAVSAADEKFPFGYGLSYTSFRYSNLVLNVPGFGSKADIEAHVTVTNVGKIAGDDVVQLYLHHDVSSVQVADRILAGFMRVHLEPGESKALQFEIPQQELAVWSAKKQWSVEPGPYTLFAGGDSDATLSASFTMGEPGWAHASGTDADRWVFAPTLEMTGSPKAEFAVAYQLALRVMEYNLRDGLLEAGKGYGTWTRDSSINAWNAASLLIPEVARHTLWHETDPTPDGPVVGGQYWDKVIWIIAAYNHVKVTGDEAFLNAAYGVALRTLAAMRETEYDTRTGLFRGPAVYGDGVAAYPDPPFNDKHGDNVLDYTEAADLETLSTNSVYYGAYRAAAAMGRMLHADSQEMVDLDSDADNLRQAIWKNLWMKDEQRFGYFRSLTGTVDGTQEALGESLAITLGVTTEEQAHTIFRHAEVTPWGVACTWKPYHRYLDPSDTVFGRHNGTIWPFINAFWATAAASVGEPSTFTREFVDVTKLALGSGDFREIYHPYTGRPYGGFQANKTWESVRHQTWSATGYLRMVYQGLFGMRFEEDELRFAPMVPASLGIRSATLHGLKYRQAELTVTIHGTGSRILRSTLDGVVQQTAVIPASLTGTHSLEITLAGAASHVHVATASLSRSRATRADAQ